MVTDRLRLHYQPAARSSLRPNCPAAAASAARSSGASTVPKGWARCRNSHARQLRSFAAVAFFGRILFQWGQAQKIVAPAPQCESASPSLFDFDAQDASSDPEQDDDSETDPDAAHMSQPFVGTPQ